MQGSGQEGWGIAEEPAPHGQATVLLKAVQAGDAGAAEQLYGLLHDELHRRAERALAGERPSHTLQATVLVNDVYMRLVDQSRVDWQGRTHFLAMASQILRRILIDHERARRTAKRGGRAARLALEDVDPGAAGPDLVDLLDLDEALRELEALDQRQARIVELRFFGGLSIEDVAVLLAVSPRTVKSDWRVARAWLRQRLGNRESR